MKNICTEYTVIMPLSVSFLDFLIGLEKTSEKRTTSLQGTNGPSPMCPLFGGFTVASKNVPFVKFVTEVS